MKKRVLAMALALVMVLGTVAAAVSAEKSISVAPMGMTINGQAVTPLKSNGDAAEVFAYDGATYVPLRYLSELLGIEVQWDESDPNTAKLVSDKIALPAGTTYEGTAMGRNGNITVAVTLDGAKIASIAVKEESETPNIGTEALKRLPQAIVEAQSLEVDGISGATITSYALKNAIKDALKKAGVDAANYSAAVSKETGKSYDVSASVVVLGGGGAGLAAAVSALESGAEKVVIVEKTDLLGGDTNVNGGIYNTPDSALQYQTAMTDGNRSQVEAALAETPVDEAHAALQAKVKADYDAYKASGETGIFDSASWFALQTWNGGDKVAKLSLVETLANNAYAGYQWLVSMGAAFKTAITQGPGSLYPRTHDTTTGIGAEFINTYVNYLEKNFSGKYEIYYGTEAKELVRNSDGVCNQARAVDKNGNSYTFTADKGIVVATGGFAGNVEMRVEYCQGEKWPNLGKDLGCSGVSSDTGDGILMAKAIGANLVDMEQIQLLHMCNPKYGTTEDNSDKDKSVTSIIFVNKEGNRFVAEDGRRDTICIAALEQTDSMFYAVESWDGNGDKTLDDLVTNNGVTYTDEIARGNMLYGETLEELAAKIGADPDNLKKSVADYNADVDAGVTSDAFGRTTFVEKLENGPWLAVPRKPSAHHTMGGIEINENTQVLDTDGKVIPGLYAAGEVTGGLHGGNRIGGNAIVDTVVMGRIAGQNVVK